MLDKGRATIAGKNGEYNYACPMDHRFLDFVGVKPDALKKQLAAGKGDTEILQWIQKNAKRKLTEPEIHAWSAYAEQRAPADTESREFFHGCTRRSRPSARTSPPGSTCSTWMTTCRSAARREAAAPKDACRAARVTRLV